MRRWNLLLRVFMSEYLHLQPNDHRRSSDDDVHVARSASELVRIFFVSSSYDHALTISIILYSSYCNLCIYTLLHRRSGNAQNRTSCFMFLIKADESVASWKRVRRGW